jgi:hypothetical protein
LHQGAVRNWLLVAAALGGGLACQEDFGPLVATKWGLVTLARRDVAGSDFTRPVALFYSSPVSPTIAGRAPPDACNVFPYPPPGDEQPVDEVDAGPSITVDVEGTEYSLVPTTVGNRTPYTMAEPGLEYTPGDSVEVSIPGATDGFPAMIVRGQTAEAFSLGPIDTTFSPGGGGLAVTWTPAGNDSSRMILSLQYHTALRPGSDLNEYLFCNFRDDGQATISRIFLNGWSFSEGGRRAEAVRWRTVLVNEDDAMLYFVSTYSVTKNTFP